MSIVEKGGIRLIQWWIMHADRYRNDINSKICSLEKTMEWWTENTSGYILWHMEAFISGVEQHTEKLSTEFHTVTANDLDVLRSNLSTVLMKLNEAVDLSSESFTRENTSDGDTVIPESHKGDPGKFYSDAQNLTATCFDLIEHLIKFA